MAVVLICGPSAWDDGHQPTPKDVRREISRKLQPPHTAILLEDQRDEQTDHDLVDKYERVLDDRKVSDVLIYWPNGADMGSTFDELLLLRKRVGSKSVPQIWILHHEGALLLTDDEFRVQDSSAKSSYLHSVARLRPSVIEWSDDADLLEKAQKLREIL